MYVDANEKRLTVTGTITAVIFSFQTRHAVREVYDQRVERGTSTFRRCLVAQSRRLSQEYKQFLFKVLWGSTTHLSMYWIPLRYNKQISLSHRCGWVLFSAKDQNVTFRSRFTKETTGEIGICTRWRKWQRKVFWQSNNTQPDFSNTHLNTDYVLYCRGCMLQGAVVSLSLYAETPLRQYVFLSLKLLKCVYILTNIFLALRTIHQFM